MPKGGKRPGAGRKPDITKQAAAEAYTEALAQLVQKEHLPIIRALIDKAKSGDVPAIKEIHERLLGKVKEEMTLSGNLNHSFNDLPEDFYKGIVEREARRITVSG